MLPDDDFEREHSTFDLDQGYSQDHVFQALSAIADVGRPRPLSLG